MQDDTSLLSNFMSRKFLQTTFVIVAAFVCIWFHRLDAVSTVTLVTGALGIYAKVNYEEKKLQGGSTV